jgi:mRNA interferase HigB
MKVHLIRKETIEDFAHESARSKPSFEEFMEKLRHADWEKPTDMKETFSATDLLGRSSNRVVFNIGGNTYRMICKYAFGDNQVHLFICWIGTHAEYTRLCDDKLQYTVSEYSIIGSWKK